MIPTPQDVDATLAGLDDAALMQLVDQCGMVPTAEWRYLRPDQRRTLRASNLLAGRARGYERAQTAAAAWIERQAMTQRAQCEAQAARDLAPLVERKRDEYSRSW